MLLYRDEKTKELVVVDYKTGAFPLALDVIARCDDVKHGRKYAVGDGERTGHASLPVGLLGTLKDWYNKRSG